MELTQCCFMPGVTVVAWCNVLSFTICRLCTSVVAYWQVQWWVMFSMKLFQYFVLIWSQTKMQSCATSSLHYCHDWSLMQMQLWTQRKGLFCDGKCWKFSWIGSRTSPSPGPLLSFLFFSLTSASSISVFLVLFLSFSIVTTFYFAFYGHSFMLWGF